MSMRSELDPLRTAPLPDSFDRTSDWLRAVPPRRPHRLPVAALLLLLVAVAAWSWPVDVTEQKGAVVEAISDERIEAGHPALELIDRIVGDDRQHLVELEALGHEWTEGTVVRYAFSGDSPVRVSVWRDSLGAVGGVRSVRVVPIETSQRRPLGVEAARRLLGVRVASRTTDRELRVELDRLFAGSPTSADHTALLADTVRVIRLGERMTIRIPDGAAAFPTTVRAGGVRGVYFSPTDSSNQMGVRRIFVSMKGKRDSTINIPLDSLSPEAARVLSDQLNVLLRRRAEPGTTTPRVIHIQRSGTRRDSLRVPIPRHP